MSNTLNLNSILEESSKPESERFLSNNGFLLINTKGVHQEKNKKYDEYLELCKFFKDPKSTPQYKSQLKTKIEHLISNSFFNIGDLNVDLFQLCIENNYWDTIVNILETQKDKLKEDTLNALLRLILSIENISFKIEDIPKSAANFILPIQSGFFTDDNKNLTGYMLQAYIVKELLSNRDGKIYFKKFIKSLSTKKLNKLLEIFWFLLKFEQNWNQNDKCSLNILEHFSSTISIGYDKIIASKHSKHIITQINNILEERANEKQSLTRILNIKSFSEKNCINIDDLNIKRNLNRDILGF